MCLHYRLLSSSTERRVTQRALGRPLIVCLDGTGNEFDEDNSNVIRFYSMLEKGYNDKQMVYYQPGIGTYTSYRPYGGVRRNISKLIDKVTARSLGERVEEAYKFIMNHYQAGDRICIFGFSRGAYTARALAGMIQKVGLLPTGNNQQVHHAYKMYADESESGWDHSTEFKKAHSIDVDISFIGVWDTVSSVGTIIQKRLPFTTNNTSIKIFRHALSLDERRARFKQSNWLWSSHEDKQKGVKKGDMPKAGEVIREMLPSRGAATPTIAVDAREDETNVREVWFAGCHADVGGGAVLNHVKNRLANIPLRWMIQQCFKTDTGIRFDVKRLRDIGLELEPDHGERIVVASERICVRTKQGEDEKDALCQIHDELLSRRGWWLLEVIPSWLNRTLWEKYVSTTQDLSSTRILSSCMSYLSTNFGRGRKPMIQQQDRREIYVHSSVRLRLKAKPSEITGSRGRSYKPKADINDIKLIDEKTKLEIQLNADE
ncbi:hypothetical protein BC629DRAFT_1289360 [Irpex lacteus]|nr:hypothetical protein BC629DRAFT_1289360 [Irpex lacteus]